MDTQAGFFIVLLFLAYFLTIQAEPISDQTTMAPEVPITNTDEKFFVLGPQGEVTLPCDTTSAALVHWKIGNTEVTEDEKHFKLLENGKVLVISNPVESILGNYTCRHNNSDTDFLSLFQVIDLPSATLLGNPFVVEGEKLELVCSVPEKLGPIITWGFGNGNYSTSADRVKLTKDEEQQIDNAVLTIENISKADGGPIYCHVRFEKTANRTIQVESFTELVVKSKLAALWPFLGICAQVIILYIIIRVYEKKGGKTEVSDSDTDQILETMPTPTTEPKMRYRQLTTAD